MNKSWQVYCSICGNLMTITYPPRSGEYYVCHNCEDYPESIIIEESRNEQTFTNRTRN